ncbi:MAG: hypothetical protein OJF47_003824 [Nitrospira sp.]|nr:MAG: hypothetical protein OJF47_003824 [Nitrospira sp.]
MSCTVRPASCSQNKGDVVQFDWLDNRMSMCGLGCHKQISWIKGG